MSAPDEDRTAPMPLSEWLEHPELFAEPRAIIPHIAYAGRTTLIAAREKSGKSTLIGQGVASLTMGVAFLGHRLKAAPALYYSCDEPVGDTLRRLEGFCAHGANTYVTDSRPSAEELERDVGATGAELAVIDTLGECWWGSVRDETDPHQVASFLHPFIGVVRRTGLALVFLHHTSKARSEYAGSRALGAKVDIIGTLTAPSLKQEQGERLSDAEDDGKRLLAMKGRGVSHCYALSFNGSRYELGDAPLPLRTRVLRALAAEPMASDGLAAALEKRKADVLEALRELKASGFVVEDKRRNRLTQTGEAELARVMAPSTPVPVAPVGTPTEPLGNRMGTGTVAFTRPRPSGSGSAPGGGIREPEDDYERDERAAMRESA